MGPWVRGLIIEAEYEANQEKWHQCPAYYIEDDGMANKDAKYRCFMYYLWLSA